MLLLNLVNFRSMCQSWSLSFFCTTHIFCLTSNTAMPPWPELRIKHDGNVNLRLVFTKPFLHQPQHIDQTCCHQHELTGHLHTMQRCLQQCTLPQVLHNCAWHLKWTLQTENQNDFRTSGLINHGQSTDTCHYSHTINGQSSAFSNFL